MKFAARSLVIVFLSVFVFNSCKNDLKLNAPYKEIPSIYAVLNPQDVIQIIRVNKVFLGEGDANQMAQVADSINYQPGDLVITLERINQYGVKDNASLPPPVSTGKQVITFRDSVIEANPGSFSKTQRVYVCSDRLYGTGEYYLTVKNVRTGNTFTSKTKAITSITDKNGSGFLPFKAPYYPYLPAPSNSGDFIDYVSHDGGTVRFHPDSANGVIYNLVIRMHFYDSLYGGQKNYGYEDYKFTNQNIKDVQPFAGVECIAFSFRKNDLFTGIGIALSKAGLNSNVYGRKMYKIQYFVYSTTQDYLDYTQFVTPSLSISQNKPLYSNFDNQAALGLFTFRTSYSIEKEIATVFISEFSRNTNTCAYRFFTASLGKDGWCN